MREFIVLGHSAPVDPGFSLDDLPGGAGRLDVLCRCVNAGFMLSHAIRRDVRVRLVLRDRVTIRFVGSDLRYLSPDERNIAALIRTALEAKETVVGGMEVESTPGIHVSKQGLAAVVRDLGTDRVVQLHETGEAIQSLEPSGDLAFVVSDHQEFTDADNETLADVVDARVAVGPRRLHADHAMIVVQNYLDTDGYSLYA